MVLNCIFLWLYLLQNKQQIHLKLQTFLAHIFAYFISFSPVFKLYLNNITDEAYEFYKLKCSKIIINFKKKKKKVYVYQKV